LSHGDQEGRGNELEFTWDPAKASTNLAKHSVAFVQAASVLADPLALTVFDEAHSEFEERWFTLGMDSAGKLLAVAHTYTATELDRRQPCGGLRTRSDSPRHMCTYWRRTRSRSPSKHAHGQQSAYRQNEARDYDCRGSQQV
jgi:hypothetical protein